LSTAATRRSGFDNTRRRNIIFAAIYGIRQGKLKIKRKYVLTAPKKQDLIQVITGFLSERHKEVSSGYLYGSFITGGPFSDVDLGLLVPAEVHEPMGYEIQMELELEGLIRLPTDVRLLIGAPISFCQNVIRKGKLILDREPNFRADFEGRVLKMYFDFALFRRRYLSEVIHAPV
jgi:predicted nucleotidyltransferase